MNINGIKLLSSRAVSKLGDVFYDYGNSTWIASMGGLIVANAILAVSNAFSSPAYKSYIPEIVDKADIITYNANLETIVQIISVSSPVLGFLIFNNFGIRITLIVDAITFLISFLFLYAIKVERVQLSKQEKVAIKNILADIADGFTYIKKEKEIMFFLIYCCFIKHFPSNVQLSFTFY